MSTSVVATPTSVVNSGNGILWLNPGNATGTGAGNALGAVVQAFSISTGVVTFVTTPQSLAAGQTVVIDRLEFGTYLNGVTFTVLSSGLTTTSFSAVFSHADVSLTYDAGTITPTTTYATATNFPYVSLTTGQNSLNVAAQDGGANVGYHPAALGFLPSIVYAFTRAIGGVNGWPLGPPQATSTSSSPPVPTLPAGSTVVGIYPYAIGTVSGGGAPAAFAAAWSGGSGTFNLNGSPSVLGSIGTSLSQLATLTFTNYGGPSTSEAMAPGYYYSDAIEDFGAVIVYTTTGTPIPSTQLQSLTATGLNLSLPAGALVLGVEVDAGAGTTVGSGTLQAQLTVAGSPVGNVKTLSTLSGWSTPYVFGGSGDAWGTALSSFNVNGSSGLGVNISGTLPSGSQINLNNLQVTVTYIIPKVVVFVSVGNTRSLTVGFN